MCCSLLTNNKAAWMTVLPTSIVLCFEQQWLCACVLFMYLNFFLVVVHSPSPLCRVAHWAFLVKPPTFYAFFHHSLSLAFSGIVANSPLDISDKHIPPPENHFLFFLHFLFAAWHVDMKDCREAVLRTLQALHFDAFHIRLFFSHTSASYFSDTIVTTWYYICSMLI